MCRLLAVKSAAPFDIPPYLRRFARVARESREWQGDGWGCAWWRDGRWQLHRSVRPVWEDDLEPFGRCTLLLAHARSAFRNDGVAVEKNMPFVEGLRAFIFNGELHGVRIRAPGATGAEKMFHFILRLGCPFHGAAFARAIAVIKKRTAYVKAMNTILADGTTLYLLSAFHEADDYFTMHRKTDGGRLLLCSEPFPGEPGWLPLPNHCLEVFP
jgi:predicted glutamine amidotransferase